MTTAHASPGPHEDEAKVLGMRKDKDLQESMCVCVCVKEGRKRWEEEELLIPKGQDPEITQTEHSRSE